jgi:hypothetical protein
MTINAADNSPRIEYSVAQGVTQTTFTVPFEFFDAGDINVYVDGALKVEGSDYTVTGGEGSTGSIIFVEADPSEIQQVTGATGGSQVVITRDIPIERTTDFNAGSDINRAALNEQLDTIIALIADVDDKANRAIQIPDYEVAPSLSLADINDRKGKVLAFDASTGAVGVGPTSYDIGVIADNIVEILDVNNQAAAAAASASAAASSESHAASSEGAAASSASAAASSASSASGSATAAASSASDAADSATAAASSASAAASSATASAGSATSAASSASSAQASADAALSALDNFDDRYLGQKTSDPTLDNDGNALVTGALYFNTTDNSMKVYDGSQWLAAYASLSGALLAANNLSDLSDAAAARTNLGLGTAATTASTDYATAAQGSLADSAVQPNDSPTFGSITVTGTVDGRDVAADGTKLDGIEAGADITDTANVTAAGALMDSELANITAVKALNQGVATTDSPSFAGLTVDTNTLYVDSTNNRVGIGTVIPSTALDVSGTITADGLTVDGSQRINTTTNDAIALYRTNWPANNVFKINVAGSAGLEALRVDWNPAGSDTQRFRINANGDISFYEDTGTTAKFFWDASAESLGIGTSSPTANNLELAHVSTPSMYLTDTGGGQAEVASYNGNIVLGADRDGTQGGANIIFRSSGTTERLRIGPAGQIGVGGANYGTSGQVLTSNGTGSAPSWQAAAGGVDVQTFTSSGTWTKPSSGTFAIIEIWGGGGGGGKDATAYNAGGGGGGAYNRLRIALSSLTSTVSVGIGAAGIGKTGADGDGTAGGTTTFGAYLTAYGGGGASDTGAGGGGGGVGSAGQTTANTVGGVGGAPNDYLYDWDNQAGASNSSAHPSTFGGGTGGSGAAALPIGGFSIVGGGGGGGGDSVSTIDGGPGGNSVFGGGGGGSGDNIAGGRGGYSLFGGSGGAGCSISGAGGAGSVPAGGGGGGTTAGGNGGKGYCIVTVF